MKKFLAISTAVLVFLVALLAALIIVTRGDAPAVKAPEDTNNVTPRQGQMLHKTDAPHLVPQPEQPQRQEAPPAPSGKLPSN